MEQDTAGGVWQACASPQAYALNSARMSRTMLWFMTATYSAHTDTDVDAD